ncbi:MAG: hypothetical protein FJ280_03420 [Planctomycetes bacterium]|nr:hypothetical protein [Planctomycetota bacterium]
MLAAGSALCAQPAAHKPLPETAVLDRVDGRLLRGDANESPAARSFPVGSAETWLFELAAEVKTATYRLPAGTQFVLLPSATLGQLIADVNERQAPRYRLSARVAQFRGRNFLLPTYWLPLSRFKDDPGPEAGDPHAPPAVRDPQLGDPNLAVPPEVLERLKKQRPLRGPRRSIEAPTAPAPVERMLVNRVGRIESCPAAVGSEPSPADGQQPAAEDCWVFVPYALGWNLSEVRYELLPSVALEQALQIQKQALDPIRFNVAGIVTEFQGRPYLLLHRAIVVYSYGNFGR